MMTGTSGMTRTGGRGRRRRRGRHRGCVPISCSHVACGDCFPGRSAPSVPLVVFLLFHLRYSNNISDTFLDLELPQKIDVLSRTSWIPGASGDAQLVVASVMAVSAFAQALTGFGFAVISVGALSSMPWLLHSELYEVITPVAATLGALVGAILLLPNVRNLAWREILPSHPVLSPHARRHCGAAPGLAAGGDQGAIGTHPGVRGVRDLVDVRVGATGRGGRAGALAARAGADAADAADVQPAEERDRL